MSESILVSLARQSIEEVLEAKRIIDVKAMIQKHSTLGNSYATFVNLYIDNEIQGSYGSLHPHKTLIEDIIYNAKFAAFEDPNTHPLSTSQYLHASVEVSILSELKEIVYSDYNHLVSQIEIGVHGLSISDGQRAGTLMPYHWKKCPDKVSFVNKLLSLLEIEGIDSTMKFYKYTVQSARDTPILSP